MIHRNIKNLFSVLILSTNIKQISHKKKIKMKLSLAFLKSFILMGIKFYSKVNDDIR